MIFVIKVALYYLSCILIASYMSLFERKLIGRIQRRIGPSNCGVCGILQPIADAIKLFFKNTPFSDYPKQTIIGACLLFTTSLCQLTLIPVFANFCNFKNGLILIILSQSLMAFSETLIGTTSNSRYGIIGGNRAYIQNIGGHLLLMLLVTIMMLMSSGTSVLGFVHMQADISLLIQLIPLAVMFFLSLLITGNRTPFDFTEAESELVAGAYVECGGILFAMIYLSDYLNLLFISVLFATLFLHGISTPAPYLIELLIKTTFCISFVILIRAILPRYTQFQMLKIAWHIAIVLLLLVAIF